MAPRKKTTDTKGETPEQAPTTDQQAAGKAQTGADKGSPDPKSVPAPKTTDTKDPAARTAQDADAGSAATAAPPPASNENSPKQSDVRAAERIAALEAQVDEMANVIAVLVKDQADMEKVLWGHSNTAHAVPFVVHDTPADTSLDKAVLDQLGPGELQVKVTGPEKGFWRGARRFGLEPVVIPAEELTRRQIAALEDEKLLTVKVEPKPASAD